MGFGGIPMLIVPLLFVVICANGYYTAVTVRTSLVREILMRIALVESLFAFPALLTQQVLLSLALSTLVVLPILALTIAFYPLKRKLIDKRMAMM